MTEEKNTQWHPAFTAAIHMEFCENKADLEFQSEVTLTFIRENPPLKLFKKLKETHLMVEEVASGIYYISRYGELSIQIIVTKELDKEQHLWINALTSQISEQHVRKLVRVTNNLMELDEKNYADSIWEVVATENMELINRLRREAEMPKALAKIMKPEIDEAFDDGFNNGFNDGKLTQLFDLLKKNIISIEDAVAETELSLEEFQRKYTEYLA